jgi:hypothetical protein
MKTVVFITLLVAAIANLIAAAALICCAIDLYQASKEYRRLSKPPEVARNGKCRRIKERL